MLVGVATGGSALVAMTAGGLGWGSRAPSVTIGDARIGQSPYAAVIMVLVSNTGNSPASSFSVSIPGIGQSQYYVTLADASTGAAVAASPSSGSDPSSVAESVAIAPGQSLRVTVVIASSSEFAVGQIYSMLVSEAGGAQAAAEVPAEAT